MILSKLLENVDYKAVRPFDGAQEIVHITDDSRKVKEGSLFIAIKGFESDGHIYIDSAIKKGASAVICEHSVDVPVPTFVVSHGRKSRATVAANFYGHPSRDFKIIGVTGTNGKTSVSTMLSDLLSAMGKKIATLGTNGNFIDGKQYETERTTPDSIELQDLFLKIKEAGVDYCLMEVSSHALSLDRVHGVEFDLGIFTNLTEDHLDFHEDMEEYFTAKATLFEISKKGLANMDDPYGKRLVKRFENTKGFGFDSESDYRIIERETSLEGTTLIIGDKELRYNKPGDIFKYNMTTVLLSALELGFLWEQIEAKRSAIRPVDGRMEIFGTSVKVVVDYAHTPDALEKIIGDVRSFAKARVITVFGCGGDRDPYKRKIMGGIASVESDYAIITNDNPRTEDPEKILADILEGVKGDAFTVELDREKAIYRAVDMAEPGDIVIVAGKGHEDYQIIGKEKIHFDDREVVKAALEEKV